MCRFSGRDLLECAVHVQVFRKGCAWGSVHVQAVGEGCAWGDQYMCRFEEGSTRVASAVCTSMFRFPKYMESRL